MEFLFEEDDGAKDERSENFTNIPPVSSFTVGMPTVNELTGGMLVKFSLRSSFAPSSSSNKNSMRPLPAVLAQSPRMLEDGSDDFRILA